jgi:ribonuclease-3 family protein
MVPYNGLTLAYIGDGVYELAIRKMLLENGKTKIQNLHQAAIKYTSASGQTKAYFAIESILSEEEVMYFKKGRNTNTGRKPKNATQSEYQTATGLESLFGYLEITNQHERIDELIKVIFQTIS